MEPQTLMRFNDWAMNWSSSDSRFPSSSYMNVKDFHLRTTKEATEQEYKVSSPATQGFDSDEFDSNQLDGLQSLDTDKMTKSFRTDFEMEPCHSHIQLQSFDKKRQDQRSMMPQEVNNDSLTLQFDRRTSNHPAEFGFYAQEMRVKESLDDMSFGFPQHTDRNMSDTGPSSFELRSNGMARDVRAREMQNRHDIVLSSPSTQSLGSESRIYEMPLEPATLHMYQDEDEQCTATASTPRQREYIQAPVPSRQPMHYPMPRRFNYSEHSSNDLDETMGNSRRSFQDLDLSRGRREIANPAALYEELVPTPASVDITQNSNGFGHFLPNDAGDGVTDPLSRQQQSSQSMLRHKAKRLRSENLPIYDIAKEPGKQAIKAKTVVAMTRGAVSSTFTLGENNGDEHSKRRVGRKSMNYSLEQKRERNRAAVKKCRQRQALKLEYLQYKAESLAAENQALSEMLVKNTELAEEHRILLKRGIQMDILLKIKEIFTQSLPKDFVLDADSIWDLNSVLAVSMPSRCYYGIESIKDFWRTSLRMRNKGKIRSFWAWLFRLPPGDRFSEFKIQSSSPTSSLYFISWTTKSTPPLIGTMVIMFGNGHRVTLHVECFGWLIWRYLLTKEPFPEPSIE